MLSRSRGVAEAEGLLDISSLNAVNEELLSLVGCIAGAFIEGVAEEEHGIQHHPTGPHVYWPSLISLLLPHISQHFRSCSAISPACFAATRGCFWYHNVANIFVSKCVCPLHCSARCVLAKDGEAV